MYLHQRSAAAARIGVAESTEMEHIYVTRFIQFWRFREKGKMFSGILRKNNKKRGLLSCTGIECIEASFNLRKVVPKLTFISYFQSDFY